MEGRLVPTSPRHVLVGGKLPMDGVVEVGAGDGAGSPSGLATIAAFQPEVTEEGQVEVASLPVLPSVTAGRVSSPTSLTRHTSSSSTLGADAVDAISPSTPNRAMMTDSVRRSARFGVAADGSSATDEDALQKAMRRKASLNLEDKGNIMSSKSFLSFSPHSINSNLSSVGFKLGSNANQIDISTRVLRHMELDRLTIVPKASTELESTYTDEEEAIATSDGQLLSHIVGEVSEIGLS